MNQLPPDSHFVLQARCAGPDICPLSHVAPGTTVCIKKLLASPEMTSRLRELGLFERQQIRLLARESSIICQVCNARLGISEKIAESILVETLGSISTESAS